MQDLWNFAVRLYARPGVERACLELQDAGCDVCLLLTGAWLEQRATPCLENYLRALHELADPWQRDVIQPLRQTRQHWRAAADQDADLAALRERVKGLELEAEKLLLQRLQALTSGWPGGAADSDWLRRIAGEESAALQVLRGAIATV